MEWSGQERIFDLNKAAGLQLTALDQNQQTIAVFMDFNKALTMCGTVAFCTSSDRYGVSKTVLQWIIDYLTNWTLSMRIGHHRRKSTSYKYPLSASVVPGSHLQCVLFVSVHKMNSQIKSTYSPTELYADDALIYDFVACTTKLPHSLYASMTWART